MSGLDIISELLFQAKIDYEKAEKQFNYCREQTKADESKSLEAGV